MEKKMILAKAIAQARAEVFAHSSWSETYQMWVEHTRPAGQDPRMWLRNQRAERAIRFLAPGWENSCDDCMSQPGSLADVVKDAMRKVEAYGKVGI